MRKKVAFLGAGSHADAILPFLDKEKYEFVGFFDDKEITNHDGFPVMGKLEDVLGFLENSEIDLVFVTIGDNQKRREIFEFVSKDYYHAFFNIISPTATIMTKTSLIGRGIFIGHAAFVGAKAQIFDNNVINTGAVVEHHSTIASHCHIAPNATINGLAKIGTEVYIGSGSTIIQLINVVNKVVIGAGAVVVKDIVESGTYVGVPARKIDGVNR